MKSKRFPIWPSVFGPLKIFAEKYFAVASTASFSTSALYLWSIVVALPRIIEAKSLMPADALMAGRTHAFNVEGGTVHWDGKFFDGAREIFCEKVYFARLDINVSAGDFVVDLGAGVGDFATLCAVRGAQVISVEAQRGFIPVIQRHLKLNECGDRVIVEWGLIGGERGFFSDAAKLKQSSHYEDQEPPKLELVSLVRKHGWERIDLLKMDIEGSEFALFESVSEWLPLVNAISMETHLDHGEVGDLIGTLEKNGFATCHITRSSTLGQSANRIGFLFATRRQV